MEDIFEPIYPTQEELTEWRKLYHSDVSELIPGERVYTGFAIRSHLMTKLLNLVELGQD